MTARDIARTFDARRADALERARQATADDTGPEEWRWVTTHVGRYEVSSHGRLMSHVMKTSRVMTTNGVNTYASLIIWGPYRNARVHVLVAEAFLGPRPEGQHVRHLDGNPRNNAVVNLAYGTAAENQQDAIAHGTNGRVRRTHCPAGHAYDEANTRISRRSSGATFRVCRICSNAESQARKAAKRKSRVAA